MYTDVFFTNRTASADDRVGLAFFQWPVTLTAQRSCVFKVVDRCPFGWSHLVRIPWNLHFRLIGQNGSISEAYPLRILYEQADKKYLLSKDGTLTLQQGYDNGYQRIVFEQVKGKAFTGVRLFRGIFPIAEQYFTGNHLHFQIDTSIGIQSFFGGQAGDTLPATFLETGGRRIRFDHTAMKSLYIKMDAHSSPQLSIENVIFW